MLEIIILILTFFLSILSAIIYFKILNSGLFWGYAFLLGNVHTLLWFIILKYSTKSSITIAAWFDVVVALGYFLGFILMGNHINNVQVLGIILLLVGLMLIN